MSTYRSVVTLAFVLLGGGACYSDSGNVQSTFPEPVEVSGPPGGGQTPPAYNGQQAYGPQQPMPQQPLGGYDPNMPADSGNPYPGQPGDPSQQMQPQGDPNDPGATADVDDQQIQNTLDGYGSWSNEDGYGQVWTPDPSVVGADFMPYESNGQWIYTDAGWGFSAGWGWGWLPFHYGRWGWFGNRWGWAPGYHWSAAAVEWRGGGGYAGWRPLGPVGANGQMLRSYDTHWRFAAEGDLGRANIHAHLAGNVADAMHATRPMGSLAIRGASTVHASSLMAGRAASVSRGGAGGGRAGGSVGTVGRGAGGGREGGRDSETPTWRNNNTGSRQNVQTSRQPSSSYRTSREPSHYQPMHSGNNGGHSFSHSFNHSSGGGHSSSGHSSGGGHSGGGGHHR
jgi:hypothetical protein